MREITHFFWFCSGAQADVLEKYPSEHSKYFSIGATVFFTALFAALAGGYALYFVFSGSPEAVWLAVFFGIIWGLAIFNLDRYIVSSISKKNSTRKQLLQAAPRFLLAVLIAIVIARPLELKIFDKEIKAVLRVNYLSENKNHIDTLISSFERKYEQEIRRKLSLKVEHDSLYAEIKHLRYVLNQEFFGDKTSQTSGIQGFGPYAKKKEKVISQKLERLNYLRSENAKADSFLLDRKKTDGLLALQIPDRSMLDSLAALAGFADRNKALSSISRLQNGEKDKSTAAAVLFITLLFVVFECLPVLVKLLSSKGPYDEHVNLNDEGLMSEMWRKKDAEDRIGALGHETYIQAETDKQSSIILKKAEVEREVAEANIEQWKSRELKKFGQSGTDLLA